MADKRLIIGIGGHAVAIDTATGEETWRTKLKGRDFVTLSHRADGLYAGTGGELFCLDPSTGTILWRNKLNGLGLGLVSFSGGGEDSAAASLLARRRAAAAAAAS
jgi:outer membrane protein assembly factor BamB